MIAVTLAGLYVLGTIANLWAEHWPRRRRRQVLPPNRPITCNLHQPLDKPS